MTIMQWVIFILTVQVIHGLGTWKLYIKAQRKPWEAFIPIYNAVVLLKIINRPWWWTILLFFPVVNLIMLPVIWVETTRSFGKNTNIDTFLAIILLGFYSYYLNYFANVNYVEERSLKPKSEVGEWVSSILFAVVAATLVHTYFIQPFVIPTSSLEKTLLVGDFLFVSKFHYGARTPMTTVAAPMVHDAIPLTGLKSYRSKPQLPYFRFPGFQKIKRNDIVVFNWPVDEYIDIGPPPSGYMHKPIDKKSNYVKRCVGIPGDSLEVRDGYVYINGKQNELPDRAKLQFSYYVTFKGQINSNEDVFRILRKYDITDEFGYDPATKKYFIQATKEAINRLKNHPNIADLSTRKTTKGDGDSGIFPNDPNYNWNNDFFGPLYIPEKGKTVDLNIDVLPLYKRIINEYEGHELSVNGNQISIDNEVVTTYTFEQDYYWMMGDNRHNSQDARAWGFVPFDHVVGKPVFVWMSWNTHGKGINKIRWKRLFTTVGGSGKPVSYLIPFLVVLVIGFGFNTWRKKRKKA